jgi:glycosyltransferase involved in cell wall biosynthesis
VAARKALARRDWAADSSLEPLQFLFLHRSFPAQYAHAARFLLGAGHEVTAISRERSAEIEGVRTIVYTPPSPVGPGERDVEEFATGGAHGLAVGDACDRLKAKGFTPDLVLGHAGWGETLFVKDVWPSAPLLGYFEFYYRASGSDADFDPEFPMEPKLQSRIRLRNAINLLALETADWGQSPTAWQRAQYPARERRRISVAHEGVDVDLVRPNPSARIWLGSGVSIGAGDPVVTYCARHLEPYRGFHVFMRALPEILSRVPKARVLVVGADGVAYGQPPKEARSWREAMLGELGDAIDLRRVHFLGAIPFAQHLTILQLSAAHVYLTYPFVLSWSLIEAMAAGCLVVASNTAPVREAIEDGREGWLVDFFDPSALADRVVEALTDPGRNSAMRERARETAIERYSLHRVCLPKHIRIWERLIGRSLGASAGGRGTLRQTRPQRA